jgi:hypothetical protein
MKILKITLITLALASITLADGEAPQDWEKKWTMKSVSTMKLTNFEMNGKTESKTPGQYWYNWETKQQRFDKDDCSFTRFAGNIRYFDTTPCRQYATSDGKR